MRMYTFQIEIQGLGENETEAYEDAVQQLWEDPGTVPDSLYVEEED